MVEFKRPRLYDFDFTDFQRGVFYGPVLSRGFGAQALISDSRVSVDDLAIFGTDFLTDHGYEAFREAAAHERPWLRCFGIGVYGFTRA
jgi:hypothetical protein